MTVGAAVLAAGRGVRFGGDKVREGLAGRPVWRHSADTLAAHPLVDEVIVVVPSSGGEIEGYRSVQGGETRTASTRAALAALSTDVVLLHDGARPFLTAEVIDRVLAGVVERGAAAPAVAVTDTVRHLSSGLLDRTQLRAMQTPQGASRELWTRAFAANGEATDDVALLEAAGIPVVLVEGDPLNVKITRPEDLAAARARLEGPEIRTGFGYDVHAYSDDPTRVLMIGGVAFPGERALEGHSDADALLHAMTDAVLGAAAMGDIGVHFPPSDERWRNAASLMFLEDAARRVRAEGWTILHVDATVVAETPRVMRRAPEIRTAVSGALGIILDRVSVKATTNEGIGFVGRREGLAATAVATLRR